MNKAQRKQIRDQILKEWDRRREIMRKYNEHFHSTHGKPVTRRDFLAMGMIQFSGWVTTPLWAPPLLSALTGNAFAADCTSTTPTGGATRMIPLISVNFEGGMAISGNVVASDQAGAILADRTKMGLGRGALTVEREFGNVPFAGAGISKFITGLRSTAAAATIANTAAVVVNVSSGDDTGNNKFDVTALANLAGLVGSKVGNLGRANTPTGINQMSVLNNPKPGPLIVGSVADIQGALGGGGRTDTGLGRMALTQQSAVYRLVQNLSMEHAKSITTLTSGQTLGDLTECATKKNLELIQQAGNTVFDARALATLQGVWGITAATASNNENAVFGSMVLNALNGNAGPVSLQRGGYDYHDKTRTTGDARDTQAGQLVGRILQSAAALNQPAFIYMVSDGSCSSDESATPGAPWTSDRGSAGMNLLFFYNPTGRRATSNFQIGYFTAGQGAASTIVPGWGVSKSAVGVVANWLAVNGMNTGQIKQVLDRVAPGIYASTAEIDTVVKFSAT